MRTALTRDPVDFTVTMVAEGMCMIEPETAEGKSWLSEHTNGCDFLISHYKSIDPLTVAIMEAGMKVANGHYGPH